MFGANLPLESELVYCLDTVGYFWKRCGNKKAIIFQIYNRKSSEGKRLNEVTKKPKGRRRASLHGCSFFGNSERVPEEGSPPAACPGAQLTRARASSFSRRRTSVSYGNLPFLLSEDTRSYTNSTIGTGDTCNEDDLYSNLVTFPLL